jgi:nucleoside 2-deoxyribosyltransferase
MTRVYLAARYDHRLRLCAYREDLRARGIAVTSRWLDGLHTLSAGLDDQSNNAAPPMTRRTMAMEDWADVLAADALVFFCEPEDSDSKRGGRHVEFGAALALGKRVLAVGDNRENVFHELPAVEHYASWECALAALSA